jgi:ABC-2 type transport system permease protein
MSEVTSLHAWLFRRLRFRQLANGLAVQWGFAKVRLLTIAVCSFIIISVVSAAALEGFWLLSRNSLPGTSRIVGLLLDFLFLTLGMMLIFSGGLILHGSLFGSAETTFLLSLPVRDDRIFAYKFQGAVGFSSWAFLLLGLPVLAAYGFMYEVHWLFWIALPLFLAGFLLIPGSIGALACLAIVNLAPRRKRQVLIAALVALIVVGLSWGYGVFRALTSKDLIVADREAVNQVLGQFTFAASAWIPSHWLTRGLQAASIGRLGDTIYPLALVWSNGLLLYLIAATASARYFRRGYNRLTSGSSLRRRYGGAWLDRTANSVLRFLDPQTRLLIVKDFRTFRRDPRQWAQIVIFVGLALIYFSNSRQFYRSDLGKAFQHGVALVNLTAICLLLCAYMGRFIYPMLSLEGTKFWILGLMPLARRRLLMGKFAFAASGSLAIAVPLVTVSDWLLELPVRFIAIHAYGIACVALGLSAMAVGIGALLPNFRETDPSKIAVGFGGTMNLLAGLMFLLLEVALIVGPLHVAAMLQIDETQNTLLRAIQFAGLALGGVISICAVILPLRAGVKALERMEF